MPKPQKKYSPTAVHGEKKTKKNDQYSLDERSRSIAKGLDSFRYRMEISEPVMSLQLQLSLQLTVVFTVKDGGPLGAVQRQVETVAGADDGRQGKSDAPPDDFLPNVGDAGVAGDAGGRRRFLGQRLGRRLAEQRLRSKFVATTLDYHDLSINGPRLDPIDEVMEDVSLIGYFFSGDIRQID